MKKNIASFTVGEKTYEIKRNRYLQAEFDRIKTEANSLDEEEQSMFSLLQSKYADLEKLALRVNDLQDKYYETFDKEAGDLYKRAKEHYDTILEQTVRFEAKLSDISAKVNKLAVDNAEKTVIAALQVDAEGKTIRTQKEAEEIWCSYVDEVGQNSAVEWLLWFVNYIVGNDNENEDPFVAQAKAKAEQKANTRKGLKMIK